MAKALFYPPANRTAQWFGDDYTGSLIDPDKVVHHTTETGGWPAYGGGASAPGLTYHAEIHEWRQHFACNRSSRALRNAAGGVQTNTEDALQVEVIAYSDELLAHQRGHLAVSDLDSEALDDLADFAAFAHREWGVPMAADPGWLHVDFDDPPMSHAAWRAFAGHVGHNRVPENTHWDPARLDINEILRRAKRLVTPTPPEDDMPYTESELIAIYQRALNASSMRELVRELVADAIRDAVPYAVWGYNNPNFGEQDTYARLREIQGNVKPDGA